MRSQVHHISLIYPPISNKEAGWLKEDPEVQEMIIDRYFEHEHIEGLNKYKSFYMLQSPLHWNFKERRQLKMTFY